MFFMKDAIGSRSVFACRRRGVDVDRTDDAVTAFHRDTDSLPNSARRDTGAGAPAIVFAGVAG